MHALKIAVGAAAALVFGAASAGTMHNSAGMSYSGSTQPWATGELWGSQSTAQLTTHSDMQGAQGRSYSADGSASSDRSSTFPLDQPSQPTMAGEAYDGKQMGITADRSSGAYGRSFSEPGMSQGEGMGYANPATNGAQLNHFHGG